MVGSGAALALCSIKKLIRAVLNPILFAGDGELIIIRISDTERGADMRPTKLGSILPSGCARVFIMYAFMLETEEESFWRACHTLLEKSKTVWRR